MSKVAPDTFIGYVSVDQLCGHVAVMTRDHRDIQHKYSLHCVLTKESVYECRNHSHAVETRRVILRDTGLAKIAFVKEIVNGETATTQKNNL